MLWAAIDVVWLCAMEAATVSCCFLLLCSCKVISFAHFVQIL